MKDRYYKFSTFLKERYGQKIRKVSVDAGFSCPNKDPRTGQGGCIFCRNDSFSHMLSEQDVCIENQIEQGMQAGRSRAGYEKFLIYFQSSTNTFAPPRILREMFFSAVSRPGIVGIAIATRPDCLPSGVLQVIKDLAQQVDVWIELGLQSSHDSTLRAINRGHTWDDYLAAVEKLKDINVRICTHLMVGLPGEDRQKVCETAEKIAGTGTQEVKIHPLLILTETGLEPLYHTGQLQSLEFDDYVDQVCDMLERLPKDMVIQRLTAEAPLEMLLAPYWIVNKLRVLNAIDRELEQRGTVQGSRFGY